MHPIATWSISALASLGVILRPWSLPEALWAVAGALALVATGLLPPAEAWYGVRRGTDVYLFLTGMMLLAELARREGLFDWLAAAAARLARGSASRLFALIYGVGAIVTIFLSNDATAVVLTPAVAAVIRAAKAENPLPYLLICAFIANAASFVLPISNPANLVIYASHMPRLPAWLKLFALPSLAAILATYLSLWLTQRRALQRSIERSVPQPNLSAAGRIAAAGILATAGVLMLASARGWNLGLPTCIAGLATTLLVITLIRRNPWPLARDISWGVLPLVAGLFVLVQGLADTGLLDQIAHTLHGSAQDAPKGTAWASGILSGLLCNLMNNLPAGLVAGGAVQAAHTPASVTGAVLIGIDLGPNLSVTGSLATILWLAALRREGHHINALTFLRYGILVMPPALLLSLAVLIS